MVAEFGNVAIPSGFRFLQTLQSRRVNSDGTAFEADLKIHPRGPHITGGFNGFLETIFLDESR
jgi:hypothetical protein